MRGPGEFDAFYEESRGRLLLQTYALTGDLRAARGAVSDAYVAAWHHWRKVAMLDDPESWVRPHAWRHAQRRHQTRIWHRDKILDDDARATLEALRKLTVPRRKMLLLTQLSTLATAQMAREVALTDTRAAEELAAATVQFSEALAIAPEAIRPRLEALADQLGEARFPDAAKVRRNGATRRRTHAVAATALGAATVVVAGLVVHISDGNPTILGEQPTAPASIDAPARLRPADLLDKTGIGEALAPLTATGSAQTDDNTTDDGRYAICQAQAFAAPDGQSTLVRRFNLGGSPKGEVVQSVEQAVDVASAHSAYQRMEKWFTECATPRVQLISAHRLDGIGDEGTLLTMRSWDDPVTTHRAAVARTGMLLTLTLVSTRGKTDEVEPVVDLAASAVRRLCSSDAAAEAPGACVVGAEAVRITPPPSAQAPGMLQVLDLPPMPGAPLPWVGVKPTKPSTNAAATRCDNASFTGKSIKRARTRTFVIPGADLPTEFGITETLGRFPNKRAAKKFVAQIRTRMTNCEEHDLATTVTQTTDHSRANEELTTWLVETEVSENRKAIFRMGIIRMGPIVAQVGFTPGGPKGLAEGGFSSLTVRALRRLENLPKA